MDMEDICGITLSMVLPALSASSAESVHGVVVNVEVLQAPF